MKKKKITYFAIPFMLAGTIGFTMTGCTSNQSIEKSSSYAGGKLPVKAMKAKNVDENPYMAKSDANIHHDGYNTDSTDEILPLGIYPEINISYEKTNPNASPAIYFDNYGNAVVPLLGGIAIRDINSEETKTLGYFSPRKHDGSNYVIQSSYTFLDSKNRIVCPTSNNHVLMLKSTDENGNVLPEFQKVLDIDIKAAAETALGKKLDQNLLSVVFDYEGNLWFTTGGFRIYPERKQQGVMGYISRSAIDSILKGEQVNLSDAVFVYELTPGEGAENGIAASKEGAVILTNQNCYLLRANNGVEKVWHTPYESVGAKVSKEGDKTTGGGLAWGGGCSPSLTPNLVMFTDNSDPNNDSSIQSYSNIYDKNWITKGNSMIAPGIERVDTIKTDSGYEMKSIWTRNDLIDTSIMKLSTSTGYIYGYVQDLKSGMWQYIILDFETGKTVFTMDVSDKSGYNNMAIGIYTGNSGNALYCPTGYLELLRLQDRFVYLPEMPYRKVDLDKASRTVLTREKYEQDGGKGKTASWLNTITVENVHANTTVAIRMNNISGNVSDLKLYAYGTDGKLTEVDRDLWSITNEESSKVQKVSDGTLYELRINITDNGTLDLSSVDKEIKCSVILAK